MADIQHSTLTSSQVHEPKHISTSGTSDAGKVITPSSTTAGTSELRKLTDLEITNKKEYLTIYMADVSTASSSYMIAPFNGTIDKVWSVLSGAIATADSAITLYINTTAVTHPAFTIAFTGSAAGDIDSTVPTALRTFTEGQYLRVATDGASANTVPVTFTFVCTRT